MSKRPRNPVIQTMPDLPKHDYGKPKRLFEVTYLWGEAPEPGDTAKTYTFTTQAEKDAFIEGVEAAEGWMGYREAPPGYVVPDEGYDESDLWDEPIPDPEKQADEQDE